MDDLTRLHVKVLDLAEDEAFVWELPKGLIVNPVSGEPFEAHPETPLADTQRALDHLLRRGLVRLHDDRRRRDFELDEALMVVWDNSAWIPGAKPIFVWSTEAGEAALTDAWPLFFGEGTEPLSG